MTGPAGPGKAPPSPAAERAEARAAGRSPGRSAPASPPPPPDATVLHTMQRAAGNAAIGTLLAGGEGRPLPPALRQDMERRFGQDFRAVRIHDGPRGAEAADAVAAKALTHGRDIAFAQGRFAPDTTDGKRLLAHELAHVVQQGRGGEARPTLDGSGPLEVSATQAADSAVSGTGPVAVAGGGATGPAAEPEEKSWWQRQRERLSTAATAAKEAYDDPRAALQKAEAKAGAVYGEYRDKAVQEAAKAKAAWDESDIKKKAMQAVEEKSIDEKLAEDAEKALPPASDDSPKAQMARSAVEMLKANAKLNNEPKRAAMRKLLEGHPLDAVEGWQKAADQGLKDMKTATFGTIDKWEDGKFDAQTPSLVDPAAHPTLSKVEQGLTKAGKWVDHRERQVVGGATKALYSMVEGLDSIAIHPVNTAQGLGKVAEMGSPLPSSDTLAEGAGFVRDLADPKVSTGDAFKRLYKAEQDKQAERQKTSVELLKGIGHNYVEAAGGQFVPPADEQTPEQKKQFTGMKPGEISWKGWSGRERLGEIPGLLLVDVGSFFIGGGEANAAAKTGRAASAAGKLGELGETANALGKLGEGSKTASTLGKLGEGGETAGTLGKLGESKDLGKLGKLAEGGDVGKVGEGAGDAGKLLDAGADTSKGTEGAGDAAKATEGKTAEAKGVGDPPASGETKSAPDPAAVDEAKTPPDPAGTTGEGKPAPDPAGAGKEPVPPGPAEPPKGPPKEPPKPAKPKGGGNKPRPRKPDVNPTDMKRKLEYARKARDEAKAMKKGLPKDSGEWKAADIRQNAANKAIREVRSGIKAHQRYRRNLAEWERANPGKTPAMTPLEQSGYAPRAGERAMTKQEFDAARRDARSITQSEFDARVDKDLDALQGEKPTAAPDASGKAPAGTGAAAETLDFTKSAESVVGEAMQEAGIKKGASVSGGEGLKVGRDLHQRIEAKWAERPELKGIKPQAEMKVKELLPPDHPARGQSVRQFLEGRGDKALIESLPDSVLKSKIDNLQLDMLARMPDGSILVWDLTSKEQVAHLAKTMLYSRIFEESGVLVRVGETFWRKF